MGSIMRSMYIARDTLLNSQLGMEVTSNNIANAENTGYARQRAVFTSNPAYQAFPGWIATGARVTDITQLRDRFLERRVLSATSGSQDFTTRASTLALAEPSLAGAGDYGMAQALGEFWDSWDNLNQNPEGQAERRLVHQAGSNLAATVSDSQQALDQLKTDISGQITDAVDDTVNPLLEQIAGYNREIVKMEGSGHTANTLRDLRYQALTELAGQVPAQFTEQDNGSVTVTVGSTTLVSAFDYAQMSYDEAGGAFSYQDAAGSGGVLGSGTLDDLSGGRVNGLVHALQSTDDYLGRLDDFAGALVDTVNAAHTQGDGTAVPIFALDADGRLQLDTDFDQNYATLIQSQRASAMSELQNTSIAALGDVTFSESLTDLQTQVGADIDAANTQMDFQNALLLDLQARQQDVSGVSIDEEMVNALQFQQIYAAAGKIVQATAEMLDTVIQMV